VVERGYLCKSDRQKRGKEEKIIERQETVVNKRQYEENCGKYGEKKKKRWCSEMETIGIGEE
jgi:hypothetical protein